MSSAVTIADALADLQALLISGEPVDDAVVVVATEYDIRADVLHSRAMRPGGLVETVSKLRRRADLQRFAQVYTEGGVAFNHPTVSFAEWHSRQTGEKLSSEDAVFADGVVADLVKRHQQRVHQQTIYELSRDYANDHAQN